LQARELHTFANIDAREVDIIIPISKAKLQPLLPPGFNVLNASLFNGLGTDEQGLVFIVK